MDIQTLYSLFLQSTGVTTDSRNCPKGSVFIALRGENFNGNTFASAALEKGCSFAVVDDPSHVIQGDERYFLVENGLKTLQALANYHRKKFNIPVIGITGTNGKTTTKELIAAVLSMKYNVLYTEGNLNNHIGVPLTLLNLTKEHGIAVIEMGASHPGDIQELVDIAEPDYGIITNVGKAHLEGFGSFEKIIETKGELYDFLRENENIAFVNTDDDVLVKMSAGMHIISYGTGDPYINGSISGNSPYLSFTWQPEKEKKRYMVNTQLIGSYNFPNALSAVTIGYYFNIDPSHINHAISIYTPTNNRSQLTKTERNTLIVDAYNANPTSMRAALENFTAMEAGNKMVILGDMLELGKDSISEHQQIINFLVKAQFDNVVLIGKIFSSIAPPYKTYPLVDEYISALKEDGVPQCKTILIKGSNGINLRRLPEFL